jgi:uncharacterized protein YbjT (DUF2867 family)
LLNDGWQVRGTSRSHDRLAAIDEAGIEPVLADPDRIASVIDHVGDVTVVCWLLARARGDREQVAAIHGQRLERMLERLVDTPVRGFVYDAAGEVPSPHLERGAGAVRAAGARWRIPVELVGQDRSDSREWADAMHAALRRLVGW